MYALLGMIRSDNGSDLIQTLSLISFVKLCGGHRLLFTIVVVVPWH